MSPSNLTDLDQARLATTPKTEGRRRRVRSLAARCVPLLGLAVLTAWNVTRSSGLEPARRGDARRDFRSSLRHALDHLDRRPWSQEAALLAARALTRLDFPAQAERYYDRAGPLSPDDLEGRAHVLLRGGHFAGAIAAYEELLSRRPDDPVALRRLAAARLGQGDHEEVLKLVGRLEHVPGGAVIAATIRGLVHHENKEPGQAVAAFEQVLALDPGLREMPLPRWLFWSHLAEDLVATGRGREVATYLEGAVEQTPDARLWCLLGRSYQFNGALDEAQRCFRQSSERDPNYDLPRFHLGQIALQRGQLEEAREFFQDALARSPKRYETVYHLALTYSRLGRPDDAERYRKRAEALRKERAHNQ